ncbi:MAG: ABC transporter permease [Planctomycetota bacterium]
MKYLAVSLTALRQGLEHRAAALARAVFFLVILLVFSRLWSAVAPASIGAAHLLWYLALTEWVALSVPMVHLDIERDVRSGDIAYALPRPASYVGVKVAEALGATVARAALLGAAGLLWAYLLAGGWPSDPRGLLLALPACLLACAVSVLLHASIGVSAFWLQDASPLYWVWQKLTFILGGLLLPLEFYPRWLRSLAGWTPFSALLHGPGSLAFGLDSARAAWLAGRLALWGVLAAALLAWVYRRGLRVLDIHGG